MTQGSGDENILAQMSKRLEDQARFTRVVSVVCTLAVLAVLYYTMTSELAVLPDLVLARLMGNMESLVHEYKTVDAAIAKQHGVQAISIPIPEAKP